MTDAVSLVSILISFIGMSLHFKKFNLECGDCKLAILNDTPRSNKSIPVVRKKVPPIAFLT